MRPTPPYLVQVLPDPVGFKPRHQGRPRDRIHREPREALEALFISRGRLDRELAYLGLRGRHGLPHRAVGAVGAHQQAVVHGRLPRA